MAYYYEEGSFRFFDTMQEAEKYLEDMYRDDGELGFSENSMNGRDFVAEVKLVSKFNEIESKADLDEDELEDWSNDDFEVLGNMELVEFEPTKVEIK